MLYSSGNIFRYSIHAHKYMEVDAMMMGERKIYFYLPSHTQPEVVSDISISHCGHSTTSSNKPNEMTPVMLQRLGSSLCMH